jgi:hypothetical protein
MKNVKYLYSAAGLCVLEDIVNILKNSILTYKSCCFFNNSHLVFNILKDCET